MVLHGHICFWGAVPIKQAEAVTDDYFSIITDMLHQCHGIRMPIAGYDQLPYALALKDPVILTV